MRVAFVGTVVSCETRFETKVQRAIPTDFNANWIVTIDVNDANENAPAQIGERVSFLIHSPAQTFRANTDNLFGRQFRFEIDRESTRDSLRWTNLSATLVSSRGT